jgi:hypothetical protein
MTRAAHHGLLIFRGILAEARNPLPISGSQTQLVRAPSPPPIYLHPLAPPPDEYYPLVPPPDWYYP